METIGSAMKVPPPDHDIADPVETPAAPFDVAAWRRRVFGAEYAGATLESYEAGEAKQRSALKAVRDYCGSIRDRFAAGESLLLIGPVGTGKDHLAVCVACAAVEAGFTLCHRVGPAWFDECRERTFENQYPIARSVRTADFLILSDPQPPRGAVTDPQARWLYELLDERYRLKRPTVATINAESASDAAERCGEASIDRLRHRSLVVWCQWASARKASRVVNAPKGSP